MNTMESYMVLALYSLLFCFIPIVSALYSITPNQSIQDDGTLVSADGTFVAGFCSIGGSENRYFGIWYQSISPRTIVWVANRDSPLKNSSGVFKVTDGGNLLLLDGSGATVWSSNASTTAKKPVVQLLGSGNLIVKDGNNQDNIVWQSYNYPGDTLLAGMKLESNLVTGQHRSLTSWRNTDDPAPGDFSLYIDPHGFPQLVAAKKGTLLYSAGLWNGLQFTGAAWRMLPHFFNYSFMLTEKEVSFGYELLNSSTITRYVLNPSGIAQRLTWSDTTQSWQLIAIGPLDQCDNYALCDANSNCNINISPICKCLEGFVPKFDEKWKSSDWSGGCVRRVNLSCNNGDGFLNYAGMKLPDTSFSWFNRSMSLDECKASCLKNCSCTAYANLDVRNGGSGCLLWFDKIMDMRTHTSEGQDIYIKVAASELVHTWTKRHSHKKKLVASLIAITTFTVSMTILVLIIYMRRRKLEKPGKTVIMSWNDFSGKNEKKGIDLPTLDLSTIANATDNFSVSNILGEGGFGPVYKATLANGQEIAVKRLSKDSGQGPEEFKNEVLLIANLQHRNLVKTLGYCIQDDERLLIYEFMPNRSLDYFIFDQTRSNFLDWNKRFKIIGGIARGLLYLHQDSRLRIIHRDLKTSNILLDKDMNPKISDFGLARTFVGDHIVAKTKRVVGSHGYMPPEYALYGSFSVKSDIFSFGVIILEIVSGKKNREFQDPHNHLNLLGHAWRLWSEKRLLDVMDESLGRSTTQAEVLRSIHVGLLCVQERPKDRPDMSCVVLMLNGERPLPKPKQPAFYPHEEGSSSSICELSSTNEMSITLFEAR